MSQAVCDYKKNDRHMIFLALGGVEFWVEN